MTYGILSRVKELLGVLDTAQDTELNNHIASADAEIDTILARQNLTVPGTVPTIIAEISAYLASAKYRRERIAPSRLAEYRMEGERMLMDYIKANVSGGGIRSVSRENLS